MRNLLFLCLVQFLFSGWSGTNLYACTCNEEKTVKQAVEHADFVAIVKVIDVTNELLTPRKNKEPYKTISAYKFRVVTETRFKGVVSKDTVIIYSPPPGECSFCMEPGKTYIIYGNKHSFYHRKYKAANPLKGKNTWWTDKCTRTKPYDENEVKAIKNLFWTGMYGRNR